MFNKSDIKTICLPKLKYHAQQGLYDSFSKTRMMRLVKNQSHVSDKFKTKASGNGDQMC